MVTQANSEQRSTLPADTYLQRETWRKSSYPIGAAGLLFDLGREINRPSVGNGFPARHGRTESPPQAECPPHWPDGPEPRLVCDPN